jgi:hypothetical protein
VRAVTSLIDRIRCRRAVWWLTSPAIIARDWLFAVQPLFGSTMSRSGLSTTVAALQPFAGARLTRGPRQEPEIATASRTSSPGHWTSLAVAAERYTVAAVGLLTDEGAAPCTASTTVVMPTEIMAIGNQTQCASVLNRARVCR